MRAAPTAAVLFVATLFVVGCSQSSLPTGASLVAAPTSLQAAPGASYNASGPWTSRFVFTTLQGEEVLSGENIVTFTQDSNGNLTAPTEDGGQITLIRKGVGPTITYLATLFEPSSSGCPEDMSGFAQLDTATNTLTARLMGVLEGCSGIKLIMTVTGTKIGV